ncbi:hypothetical protein KIN20_009214 [Parelaphostrongylus tenuis]|uniref:Uncharacterized protein n=1 Tax=Parelaphostrongylus tenuis TaxID=148309 RepID=A0AAD5M600_PARTN|nr:hypothetical protein KIN20_009214 [Parelaphostrongylus tenuis]
MPRFIKILSNLLDVFSGLKTLLIFGSLLSTAAGCSQSGLGWLLDIKETCPKRCGEQWNKITLDSIVSHITSSRWILITL